MWKTALTSSQFSPQLYLRHTTTPQLASLNGSTGNVPEEAVLDRYLRFAACVTSLHATI